MSVEDLVFKVNELPFELLDTFSFILFELSYRYDWALSLEMIVCVAFFTYWHQVSQAVHVKRVWLLLVYVATQYHLTSSLTFSYRRGRALLPFAFIDLDLLHLLISAHTNHQLVLFFISLYKGLNFLLFSFEKCDLHFENLELLSDLGDLLYTVLKFYLLLKLVGGWLMVGYY